MTSSTATRSAAATRTRINIDQSSWEEELTRADVSKADLNALVFDYLLIEGFPTAAIEFARETGLPHDVDHALVQERMEIRECVEEGRVDEAIKRVNELDPEILDTNPPLLFHLHLLHLIELIRLDHSAEALAFAMTVLAPRGAQNPEFLADLEKTMALLAFPDIVKYADNPSGCADPLMGDPVILPIVGLMRRSQRVKVGRELNAAILESQGLGGESKVKGLVRLMNWGEERLEGAGISLPSGEGGGDGGAGEMGRGSVAGVLRELGG